MLPNKKDNIYPYSKENVYAILNFYFDIPFGDIDWIYNSKELHINQLEWIAKEVSKNIKYLKENVGGNGNTVSNFMKYGVDAMCHEPNSWNGSKNRIRIIRELKELILPISDDVRKNEILKTIEGLENTIWAYKVEFTDLDENHRKEVIKEFEKRKRLQIAKIKAIEIKRKLKDID